MNFDLKKHLIFLTVSGSQSYGLATETSDLDLKGICIPNKNCILGAFENFEQAENNDVVRDYLNAADREIVNKTNKIDSCIYGFVKYLKLAADCNPNIIELLWIDDADIRLTSKYYEKLREHRDLFLSKKARFTFTGYAWSQINRMKTHRDWLINPIQNKPERKDYHLVDIAPSQINECEALIRKQVDAWDFHDLQLDSEVIAEIRRKLKEQESFNIFDMDHRRQMAMNAIGFEENLQELIKSEYKYRTDLAKYNQYQDWKKNRNSARAEMEAKYGFDVKHASHVIRLLRMGKEILEGKGVIVKRPDWEDILSIRRGKYSYDQILEETTKMEKEIEVLYSTTSLPHACNKNKINQLCVEIQEEFLNAN